MPQTLEAEADRETEALAEASKAKRKDVKNQPPAAQKAVVAQLPAMPLHLGNIQLPYTTGLVANGIAPARAVQPEQSLPLQPALAMAAPAATTTTAEVAPAAVKAAEPDCSSAGVPVSAPAAAAEGEVSAADAAAAAAARATTADADMDAAMAAAMPVDVSKLLLANRQAGPGAGLEHVVGRRANISIPQDFKGPDSGPGAAAGQALGLTDACWTVSKESIKEQRGAKRKRVVPAGSSKAVDGEAADSAGAFEAAEEQPAASAVAIGQPPVPTGRPLAAGSRPAWLDEAEEGSAHLNKRRAKTWQDDPSKPQEVEFMLGCHKCSYQRVRRLGNAVDPWCR